MEDLWPADIGTTTIRPPLQVLKEQATQLGGKTQGLVEGEVTTTTDSDGDLRHHFRLVAPMLDSYTYQLFQMYHGATLYPATVIFNSEHIKVDSDDRLMEVLREIFSHENTRRIVAALLAQSRS
jgi:hypothetical protein